MIQSPKTKDQILSLKANGFDIFLGLDASSNEHLVGDHRRTHPDCLWFHAVGCVGPHLVLCIDGVEPDEESINEAAILSAHHSQHNSQRKIKLIRMARLKHVVKAPGGKVGAWSAQTFLIRQVA